ncbi:hypothetical protein LTR78_008957 [Recurvomyces mirabilis]|uniref:Uncharacterized protein n=1 Tax=Recurvomyces mirabilis TaxID=574656 RepID=A0AAE0TSJ3_9PEZI|nr:hypothetical protein LTR78_008957 [Recurvomyces mirabilis]KAK5159758.1 hypothetical protein LTS14_001863 [Recurvomyces mirabilis]
MATFEKPSWSSKPNVEYKRQYQRRKTALLYGARFDLAIRFAHPKEIPRSIHALEVLKELLLEARSEQREAQQDIIYPSANIEHVKKFLQNHGLLNQVFTTNYTKENRRQVIAIPKELLQTVQVLLAPAMFDIRYSNDIIGFPQSQQVVYSTVLGQPIFAGCNSLDVNTEWVLHNLNFWRYHMLRESEATLAFAFKDLAHDELPRFWQKRLTHGGGDSLGKHWKGSYAYVGREDIGDIRAGEGAVTPIIDEFNGDDKFGTGAFQDLQLSLVDEEAVLWPPSFEEALNSLVVPECRAKTRAQKRSAAPHSIAAFKPQNFQFNGEGSDNTEEFNALGWLNALPPQHDVPGWQRMTMMKYFQDPDTGLIDEAALWAYEGVVLPGGQIIVGRWWCVDDGVGEDQYSGPFVLWCVDGPRYPKNEGALNEDDLP